LNLAIFSQIDMPVGDAGGLTLGLRVENRGSDYADSDGLAIEPGETMVGGEIAYQHEVSTSAIAYLSASRGYKAGGFNLGLVPDGRREFGNEVLWSIEGGIKSAWLDGVLAINASVFYNRRDDQQVRTSQQLNPNDPASFVFFTDNAAKGESYGFEADLNWTPTDSLSLFATIGLLDASFDAFVTPDIDLSGREQAHAPRYSLAAGGSYRHAGGLFARIDIAARDSFYFDVSHDEQSRTYELVNARLGFEAERWAVQVWARNLFDETYAVRGFFFGNEPPDFSPTLYIRQGDPRQLGVTLDINF
jgi:outer membrane receptor protein involved in Fe transport